jgi:hypothetical protein
MPTAPRPLARGFKTAFFAKQARKAKISDQELCRILLELAEGKATDLGGGVFKKRLQHNEYRSILIAKSDDYWILEFLFAKKDADNITATALDGFRVLADRYATLSVQQLDRLLEDGDLLEICDDAGE